MNPGKEVHFVPDFTLFCTERTIYMKVTKKLYATAIRTTEIEKQRTSSMNNSLSGVAIGNDDTMLNMELHSLLPREPKSSRIIDSHKLRKISMSTNLPDSSLFLDHMSLEKNNASLDDEKLVVSYNQDTAAKPPKHPPPKDTLKHSQTAPVDSILKRSDAVDLLMEDPVEKTSTGGQFQMTSLSKDGKSRNDEQDIESKQKAGNGSLKSSANKTTNSEQKTVDLEDNDETSHLI